MNKGFKCVAVLIIIISVFSLFSFASGEVTYTFYYDDREVTIESTHLNEEKAQLVADYIVYGIAPSSLIEPENEINTNLICTLFGHSIETSIALETIHNAYTTSPKCVQNTYQIDMCTRSSCDYIQKTLIDSTRTSLCHG